MQFKHLVTPSKGVIVLPAVYHFDFSHNPVESGWGWVRASDLLIAVNYNRFLRGGKELTANGVTREYPEVFSKNNSMTVVCHDGCLGGGGNPEEWFDGCVQYDQYIPARIATDLLRLVKATNPRLEAQANDLEDGVDRQNERNLRNGTL
jgi:hypothetical protein